ncbi:hypothetical protein GHT09_008099 [Marmota monax]|uniref:Uncharacterized protein n=1 Tax=Marmota monax TaxID=9995 RepID=A0A834PQN8_MARMO|nr:hypothetical protein GHT09_008099 [Marmota monax]
MNLLSWARAAVCSFHRRQMGPNSSFHRLLRAFAPFSRPVQCLPSHQRLRDSDYSTTLAPACTPGSPAPNVSGRSQGRWALIERQARGTAAGEGRETCRPVAGVGDSALGPGDRPSLAEPAGMGGRKQRSNINLGRGALPFPWPDILSGRLVSYSSLLAGGDQLRGSVLSERDYESLVMMRLRQAAERQQLIAQMQQEEEGQPT